jgi:hypothetical protein
MINKVALAAVQKYTEPLILSGSHADRSTCA